MKISLIAFASNLTNITKQKLIIETFNNTKSHLLLFPGRTLSKLSQLFEIENEITNNFCTAFLEVKNIPLNNSNYWSFKISDGKIINNFSNQIFTQSSDFKKYSTCAAHLYKEITDRRMHTIDGRKVLLLICGELNILKNTMPDNSVSFRTSTASLESSYQNLFGSIDIILNPIHSSMGNQGKMQKRREFLTQSKRSYFSTCNFEKTKAPQKLNSIQYAYFNGKAMAETNVEYSDRMVIREYELHG